MDASDQLEDNRNRVRPPCPGWPANCWWAVWDYAGPAVVGEDGSWARPVKQIGFVLGTAPRPFEG